MNLIEFSRRFGTEQQCEAHFIRHRMEKGVVCKKCQGTEQYWLSGKKQFQCARCEFRTTLRSGTALQWTKLPFQYWYTAMFLMTFTKKGLSALELQRQLGHKRYEPLWSMMQKIRLLMAKRSELYKLKEVVEADVAFFETTMQPDRSKKRIEKGKMPRGKGSPRTSPVLVVAESLPGKVMKHNKAGRNPQCRKLRYIHLQKLDNYQAEHLLKQVGKTVDVVHSKIITDKGTEMSAISRVVLQHEKVLSTPENNDTHLHWVNVVIANAKNAILGIYHRVSNKYLQNYLAEFEYKVNRRLFGHDTFERLMNIAVLNF